MDQEAGIRDLEGGINDKGSRLINQDAGLGIKAAGLLIKMKDYIGVKEAGLGIQEADWITDQGDGIRNPAIWFTDQGGGIRDRGNDFQGKVNDWDAG